MPGLQQLVDIAVMVAERCFEQDGYVAPVYLMVEADGSIAVVAPPAGDDRDLAVAAVREFMRAHAVARYVFVSEAWTVEAAGEAGIAGVLPLAGRLAEHPDRVEVLLLVCEDACAGQRVYRRRIVREPGRRPRLGPLERQDGQDGEAAVESQGRMVGLLPRPAGAVLQ